MAQFFLVFGSYFWTTRCTNQSSYSPTGLFRSLRPLTATSAVSTRQLNCSADSEVTWGNFMSNSRCTYNRRRLLSYRRFSLSHATPKLVKVRAMPLKACLAGPATLLMRYCNLIWFGIRPSWIALAVKSTLKLSQSFWNWYRYYVRFVQWIKWNPHRTPTAPPPWLRFNIIQ